MNTNFMINTVMSSTPLALKPSDGYCRMAVKGLASPIVLLPVSAASVVWYSGRVAVDLTKLTAHALFFRSHFTTSRVDLDQHCNDWINGTLILINTSSTVIIEAAAVAILVAGLPIFKTVICFSLFGSTATLYGFLSLATSTDYFMSLASHSYPSSAPRSSSSAPRSSSSAGPVSPVTMDYNCLRVVFDKLQSNPETILKLLSENSFYSYSSPLLRIKYLDSHGNEQAGIDAGGLTRDFYSRFFMNFTNKASFTVDDQGSILLTKRSATTREFEVLGKLLGFAHLNNVTIGNAFSISLYNMVRAFNTEVFEKSFNRLSDNELIALYIERTRFDSTIGKLVEYSQKSLAELKREGKFSEEILYYAYPDGDFPKKFSDLKRVEANFVEFQKVLKQNLLTNAKNDPTLEAAFYIGRGLARTFAISWDRIRAEESYSLCEKFQGVLSREDLLAKINCSVDSISSNIRRWIQEADLKMLENFIFATTGARALGVSDKIWVSQSFASASPLASPFVFHTCSKTVDVPAGLSYADFKERIEMAVQGALTQGFLIS